MKVVAVNFDLAQNFNENYSNSSCNKNERKTEKERKKWKRERESEGGREWALMRLCQLKDVAFREIVNFCLLLQTTQLSDPMQKRDLQKILLLVSRPRKRRQPPRDRFLHLRSGFFGGGDWKEAFRKRIPKGGEERRFPGNREAE